MSIENLRKWEKENPERIRVKRLERKKRYRLKYPNKAKEEGLKRRFNLTLIEKQKMLEEQGGCCAICGTDKPRGRHNEFHVDHDKQTGVIRGILCGNCNMALGLLKHSIGNCLVAAQYLDLKGTK